jgi:hypothetical protein
MMASFFNKSNNISRAKEVLCLKRRLFSLVVCYILVLSLFSFSFSLVYAPSGDGVVEVDVPPRGTFLHAIDGFPYHGAGDKVLDETLGLNVIIGSYYNVEDPAIVDLHAEGFAEGDKIIITYMAKLYYDGTYHPTNPDAAGWSAKNETDLFWGGLLGVFSTTSNLKDIKEANRVPDAVGSGISEILTPTTKWYEPLQEISDKLRANGIAWYTGPEDTDIPYDFKITNPHQGFEITIPRNARFLFLCCIDDMYYDNLGEIKVTIEKDSDLDGIPDHWEINGIDINNDGTVDLDLPALGADWEHKDIFVEVDYMGSFGDHNHKPNPTAISDVIQAFANAPVNNPDNIGGINLHVFIDEELAHQNEKSFDDVRAEKVYTFGTAEERTKPKTIEAKELVFHYCLFAHKQPGGNWGGMGEVIGNDFMVSLGAGTGQVGTINDQAEVFMHELGHNLGLRHGGNEQTNFKPNYISIMNYLFQYDSYNIGRPLDFSSGNKAILIESSLDENNGIGDPTTTVWRLANGTMAKSSGAMYIDWDADGNITRNVNLNLNNHPPDFPSGDGETLTDYNDWENLVYRFRGYPNFAFGLEPESHHELTWEQIQEMNEEYIIEVPTPDSYEDNNQNQNFEIYVSARGTFLRAEPFQGSPPGGSAVENAAIIDLNAQGFKEGDSMSISYSGTIYTSAYWSSNDLGDSVSAENLALIGVFSTTNILESVHNINRVPGAIDYGTDYDTGQTHFNLYDTNIQEDFKIEPNTGFTIQIPKNAKYLFLCISDSFYPDNVGTIKISIELSGWSDFLGELTSFISTPSVELIIIIAVGLSTIILVLLLLNKRRNKKDEKPLEITDVK